MSLTTTLGKLLTLTLTSWLPQGKTSQLFMSHEHAHHSESMITEPRSRTFVMLHLQIYKLEE